MPALELFGRRWHIATDDLPIPSLMGAVWHFAILVLNSVDLAAVTKQLDSSCAYRTRHIAYLSSHLVCFAVNAVLHSWTFFESIRGTMFQVRHRRLVGPLVLAVMFFYCLTIASNGYGTHLVYFQRHMSECETLPGPLHLDNFALTEAIVIATWVSLFVGFVAIAATLNLFSTYQAASSPWLSRLRLYRAVCFCCCVGACGQPSDGDGGNAGKVDDTTTRSMSPLIVIANIFTHIFGGVDMVLSDYMAAFTLLGVQHSRAKPALTYASAPPPRWLTKGSGTANGATSDTPDASWRAADGTEVILQPPPVMELEASSCRSPNGLLHSKPSPLSEACGPHHHHHHQGPGAPQAANHVALELGLASAPSTSPKPTTATITTTSEAFLNGSAPTAITATAITTSATTTSATSTAAEATAGVDGACSSPAKGATAPSPTRPADGCGGPVVDVDVVGVVVAPGSARVHEYGRSRRCLLRQWNPGDLVQPNASIEVMEEALYYMRFATAVYGWKMYLWMNRLNVTNCCRLCMGRSCGCCRQSSYFIRAVGPDYGPSEGCCSAAKLLEREAITQLTEVPDDDILYVCYDNSVGGLLPYYIALDRQRGSVVVGVRGSLSLSDMVTDLLCEPAEYDVPGVPSTDDSGQRVLWAHRGMLESTRAILRDIQEQGVLQAALAAWPEGEAAQQQMLQQMPSDRARAVVSRLQGACAGYRLVITGHSLGAGVTGLLGPLLRNQYPTLRCWAFAPPGGLMSPQAAELTHGFCISMTHAKDMIPRLGIKAMEAMVQDLIVVSAKSRVNKVAIMGRLVLLGERPPLEQLFRATSDTPEPELERVLEKHNSRLQGTPSCKVAKQFDGARDFVPPGHMLYVERRKRLDVEAPCCTCNVCMMDRSAINANYACRWIEVKDLMQTGLVISRSMFLDHLPDNTMYAMQAALQQMRGDSSPPPRPESSGFERCNKSDNSGEPTKAPAAAPAVLADSERDVAAAEGEGPVLTRAV